MIKFKFVEIVATVMFVLWVVAALAVAVFVNFQCMKLSLGETLGTVILYVFAFGWMFPFFLIMKQAH